MINGGNLTVETDISGLDKYSYSKLSTICQCPYAYDLTYNRNIRGEQNGFSECGSFVHSILEKFFKGDLLQFELKDYFIQNFDDNVPNGVKLITASGFSVDLTEKYKAQISDFLDSFDGFVVGNRKLEIVGVERQFTFVIKLGEKRFVFTGILDVIAKDKDDEYYILDHKSKSGFKTEEERNEYAKQLYVYSTYIKHNYGKYPKAIIFDMFRVKKLDVIDFNLKEYDAALTWLANSIEAAESEELFLPLDFSEELNEFNKRKEEYNNLALSYASEESDSDTRTSYREAKKGVEDKLFFCMNLCNHSDLCDAWKDAQKTYEEILDR